MTIPQQPDLNADCHDQDVVDRIDDVENTVCASVVVPCFNEGDAIENLANTLKEVSADLSGSYRFQFILVDDGSDDETWDLLADHFAGWEDCLLLRHQENLGLMAAIMTGTKAAACEIVCSMDSDCTYHPSQLPSLIDRLDSDVAMVTSSPYHPLGRVKNVPDWRITLSKLASKMYARIFRNKLYCYTSCFRAYRKSVVANIQLENSGFVGTTELLWRIEQQGDWRIVEVPATLDVRRFGQSHCRVAQVTFNHLLFMGSILRTRLMPKSNRTVIAQQDH